MNVRFQFVGPTELSIQVFSGELQESAPDLPSPRTTWGTAVSQWQTFQDDDYIQEQQESRIPAVLGSISMAAYRTVTG